MDGLNIASTFARRFPALYIRGLASKQSAVRRRWGVETRNVWLLRFTRVRRLRHGRWLVLRGVMKIS